MGEHPCHRAARRRGAKRNADSIAACDEHGIAMVFTGVRHFRHCAPLMRLRFPH
jgi:hypothetical protein